MKNVDFEKLDTLILAVFLLFFLLVLLPKILEFFRRIFSPSTWEKIVNIYEVVVGVIGIIGIIMTILYVIIEH